MRSYSTNEPRTFAFYGVTPARTAAQNRAALQEAAGNLAAATSGPKEINGTGQQIRIEPGITLSGVLLKADYRTHFKGSPHGARFIIEDNTRSVFKFGNGAGIQGFDFDYPLNNLATTTPQNLTVYPAAIILDDVMAGAPQSLSVMDCGFIGGSSFIDFSSRLNQDIHIKDLYGYPLHGAMVKIDQCNDIPYVDRVHVNPGAGIFYRPGQANTGTPCSQAVINFVVANAAPTFDVNRTDEFLFTRLFAFGVRTAFKSNNSYGLLAFCNADMVETMFDIAINEARKSVRILACTGFPSAGPSVAARNGVKFSGAGGTLEVDGLTLQLGTNAAVTSSTDPNANAAILVNGTGTQRLSLSKVKCHSAGTFTHDIQRVNASSVIEHSMFNIANATTKNYSPPSA